jgi:transposase-like protein
MTTEKLKITKENKASLIVRMLPPYNEKVSDISLETGINKNRLYSWRKKAREQGVPASVYGQGDEKWSSRDKFLIVVETMSMNETELGEYCRAKGLYKGQIETWKVACIGANDGESIVPVKDLSLELKEAQENEKKLSIELRVKEKALAEAAALLLLRKKAHAIWGENEDEA